MGSALCVACSLLWSCSGRCGRRTGDLPIVHARIDHGTLEAGEGALAEADLVIETGPAFRALLAGELSPADAIQAGSVRVTGDPDLLARFVEAFHIPPAPLAPPT